MKRIFYQKFKSSFLQNHICDHQNQQKQQHDQVRKLVVVQLKQMTKIGNNDLANYGEKKNQKDRIGLTFPVSFDSPATLVPK